MFKYAALDGIENWPLFQWPPRVRGWTRLSEATAARNTAPWRPQGDIFPQIMCRCDQTELNGHFFVGLQLEALEAVVELYIAKDGLWLDWPHAPMVEPTFAGK